MTARKITEYEKYLRVPELLSLQKPTETRSCPDELLFQVVHQVEELWMKLVLHELDEAVRYMDRGDVANASLTLARIHVAQGLMCDQLRLVETLSPDAYYRIRAGLGHGSGQESPGFNAILTTAPAAWASFSGLLERRGISLLQIHQDPKKHADLYQLAEGLLDYDRYFQRFRYDHLAIVRRIIGMGTPSLKGKASEVLERSMKKELFPELWKVRETIFERFTPGPPVE